jgi:hypothetical protein
VQITHKYDRYVIDCVDLRRYSDHNDGYSWILNIVNSFSKFVWSYKLKTKSADEVATALQHCFYNFGTPTSIQADNGKEFSNQTLNSLCRAMNIQMIHGRPRNPKAQGMVERVNQTIKRWLGKVLTNRNSLKWIDFLEKVVYKYNISLHQATRKSPFQLFFGRPGFNIPGTLPEIDEFGNIAEAGEQEEIIYENCVFIGDEELRTESVHIELNENNNVSNELLMSNLNIEDTVAMTESTNISEALRSFETYSQRTIRNANSNFVSRNINIGDKVKIAKDFDNNTHTRRQAFDSFYEENDYEVIGILQNNMYQIKNVSSAADVKIVFKGRLKKLNR